MADSIDDIAQQIALPSEVPSPIDFSKLPANIIRSASLEATIAQNEDLMARLAVTLRRLAIVEESNLELQSVNQKLVLENQTLTDQCLVRQKKDDFWKEKLIRAEEATQKIQKELELLEMRFAVIYTESEKQLQRAQVDQELNERKIKRLEKYRVGVKEIARQLREQRNYIDSKLNYELQKNRDLESKITELTEYIRMSSKKHDRHVAELIEAYECRLKELKESKNADEIPTHEASQGSI